MSTKPRAPDVGRMRSTKAIQIKLPAELDEHLDRIVEIIKADRDLESMLHWAPYHLANLDRKPTKGRGLKSQIIEFLIINHINDFTRTFTPNVEPFDPHINDDSLNDDGEPNVLDRLTKHHTHLDKLDISRGIEKHPNLLLIFPTDPRELPDDSHSEIFNAARIIREFDEWFEAQNIGDEPGYSH